MSEAPRLQSVDGLPEAGLRLLRPWASSYLDRQWDIRERGGSYVPDDGPVILASNHLGWLDGPLLIIKAPRPAHAMVKSEAFTGKTGRLLRFAGQIRVERNATDAGALRQAMRALRAGQVVALYPEGTRGGGDLATIKSGVAWLALATGAPVVPVAIFGTREPGGASDSKPEKGARIDIVYGAPITVPAQPWPRDNELVADVTGQIHEHLRDHLAWAQDALKRTLPGPLPAGSADV